MPGFSAMPDYPIYHTHTQRLTSLGKGAQARQVLADYEEGLLDPAVGVLALPNECGIKAETAAYDFRCLGVRAHACHGNPLNTKKFE